MTAWSGRRRGRKLPVVFAVATLLIGCGSASRPNASVASALASAPPAASSSANATPTSTGLSWKAADATSFGSARITDMIATSTGFLAVGHVKEDAHTNGAIWTSADGSTWERVDSGAEDHAFLGVVAVGSRYVAISVRCDVTGGECNGPSSWTSTDGKTWQEHPMDACCLPNDLAATSTKVLSVGADISTGYPQKPTDVAAFVATDGTTWTRATGDQTFKEASMGAVGARDSGFASLGNSQTSMVAWTSVDGSTWTAAPASDALKTAQASDMTTFSNLFVAVGRDGTGAVSWTSPDGKSWTRSAGSAETDGAAMNKVTVAGQLMFAVGHDTSFASAIWSSSDGLAWSPQLPLPGGANDLTAVAGNDNQVVAFGSTASGSTVLLVATQ